MLMLSNPTPPEPGVCPSCGRCLRCGSNPYFSIPLLDFRSAVPETPPESDEEPSPFAPPEPGSLVLEVSGVSVAVLRMLAGFQVEENMQGVTLRFPSPAAASEFVETLSKVPREVRVQILRTLGEEDGQVIDAETMAQELQQESDTCPG